MKLIILKTNLINALNAVKKSVGFSAHLPILKNVLFEVHDSILVSSTNLELAVKYFLSGKIVEAGKVAVPFSLLSSIVRNLNAERITIESKDNGILVTTDNYEAFAQGQDAHDFPIIPAIQNNKSFIKINSSLLKDYLTNVAVATQYSEIRPEISGVYLSFFDNKLTLVATDSFRLAERILSDNDFQTNIREISAIIPLKTIQEILKMLDFKNETDDNTEIFIDPNQILFRFNNQEVTSRLIDGTFPDYKAIIPKEIETEVLISRQEFINAIKLVSSFSGKAQDITMKVGDNKKFLELYSSESSLGENKYKLPIKLNGEKFTAVFNWRYLMDGVKIYKSEEFLFGINSPQKPAVIKSSTEPNLVYVVMPIKG